MRLPRPISRQFNGRNDIQPRGPAAGDPSLAGEPAAHHKCTFLVYRADILELRPIQKRRNKAHTDPLDPKRPALASRQQWRMERLQGYAAGLAPAAFSRSAVLMSAAPVPTAVTSTSV